MSEELISNLVHQLLGITSDVFTEERVCFGSVFLVM